MREEVALVAGGRRGPALVGSVCRGGGVERDADTASANRALFSADPRLEMVGATDFSSAQVRESAAGAIGW